MRAVAAALLLAWGITAPAHAVIATAVKVTNADATWLQVSEVVATQAYTNADVALASAGATATSSGSYQGFDSSGYAIDGIAPAAYPNIYHSSTTYGAFLTVTFAQAFDLVGLTLYGRDGCDCSSRDRFSYQLLDAQGGVVASGILDARNNSHMAGTTFAAATAEPSAAPEPAGWAMMLGGFGLVGGALRRRHAAARAPA